MLATTANMAGSPAAALDPITIGKVLFGTGFGRVWCWHLLFATLTIRVCVAPNLHWRVPAILVIASLLVLSLGWVGHAVEG
jgi:copper resistance protein D